MLPRDDGLRRIGDANGVERTLPCQKDLGTGDREARALPGDASGIGEEERAHHLWRCRCRNIQHHQAARVIGLGAGRHIDIVALHPQFPIHPAILRL